MFRVLFLLSFVFLVSCSQTKDDQVDESGAIDGNSFFDNRSSNKIDSSNQNSESYYNSSGRTSFSEPEYSEPGYDKEFDDEIKEVFLKQTPVRRKFVSEKLDIDGQGLAFEFYFDFDKREAKTTDLIKIKQHANFLKAHPDLKLRLLGHTDARGTREYNLALGENRGLSIKKILNLYGANNIDVVSYGEEKPKNNKNNESGWKDNRRVDFVYY